MAPVPLPAPCLVHLCHWLSLGRIAELREPVCDLLTCENLTPDERGLVEPVNNAQKRVLSCYDHSVLPKLTSNQTREHPLLAGSPCHHSTGSPALSYPQTPRAELCKFTPPLTGTPVLYTTGIPRRASHLPCHEPI